MATADLSFDMRIKGTSEEVASILNIMLEYDKGKNGAYFSCTSITIGDKRLSVNLTDKDELMAAITNNDGKAEISALGPFGRYGELDEIDIFREMAQAAPKAAFTATIEGFAGYADQSLSATLADGLLKVSTYYLADDSRGGAELEYFSSILSYEKFIDLFRLDGEQFDEEMYDDFILDNFSCFDSIGEFFEDTDYEEFIDLLDAECPLTEDEYSQAAQQLAEMDFESFEDYAGGDFAEREEYTYDPVEKKYLDHARPKMKTGVAYSINDDIREYLDSTGHPSDDETINNLSVEDVYAIMAGTYGKDTSTEAEECESEDSEENADILDAEECAEAEEVTESCAEENAEEADSESNDTEDSAQEESDDEDSDVEYSNNDGSDDQDSDSDTVSDAETANAAESGPETAEYANPESAEDTENKSPANKKSFPVWLIVLLIAVILIGLAAYVSGFGEKIFNYIADLLGIAVRLL